MTAPAPAPAAPRIDASIGDARAYHEALRALAERGRFGIRLGLGRTRALLRELGDPQVGIRGALVAGTNGKGSVLALAGSALRAAGLRVGETPKPHLVSYRERIVVDGRPISPADFTRLASEAIAAADRIERRLGPPTEFELLTAMLFRRFAEVPVDVALVEVGLGGRLDATHAWDGGVAVVTNVALDHTDRLGTTIAQIAHEKAAIIERGDLALTGATGEALAVVRRRARAVGAPLTTAQPAPLIGWDRDGIEVELPGLGVTRIGLRGRHQAANVSLADALLSALQTAGIAETSPDDRRTGYAGVRWPGRLELLEVGDREVLLDGAHNPAGAATLATAIDDLRPHLAGGYDSEASPPIALVTGVMADKDVDGIVTALLGSASIRGATVVATRVDAARALPAEALAARWRTIAPAQRMFAEPEPRAALERALRETDGPVVVAGSLYLVGAIRGWLVDDPFLREPDDPS